eukprot:3934512-Pyramimonas_sp.AAC.1
MQTPSRYSSLLVIARPDVVLPIYVRHLWMCELSWRDPTQPKGGVRIHSCRFLVVRLGTK